MRGVRLLVAAVLLVALDVAVAHTASWRDTRVEVVDPLHQLLHHTYPDALAAGDRKAVEELFAGDASASLALMARFQRIDRALADIDTVDLEAEPVRARVHVTIEGVAVDGTPATALQSREMQVAVVAGADDDAGHGGEAHDAHGHGHGAGAHTHGGHRGWRIVAESADPVELVPRPRARFVDEASERGLRFTHEVAQVTDLHGKPQQYVFGSGVASLDVNGDGWDDVILGSRDRLRLFVNREGRFDDQSEAWGLGEQLDGILTVVLPFDLDDDGRTDLFVGAENAQPTLFKNDGTRFRRLADTGLRTTELTISAVAADFDGDGLVDLFLANHEDVFRKAPDPPGRAENAEPDQLFLNNGDGTFHDATKDAGIDNTGWSLAPAAADYDLDGDVDLFVGNDFGTDVLYRNDGSGHFDEVSAKVGVDMPVASMSADWGDFDADGDLDLFVGGMRSGSAWVLEVPDFPVDRVPRIVDWMFRDRVREIIRSWFRGNRLYENLGDGTFQEFSKESGAQNSGWAWGTVFLDFDNDGRLDLYGANGFISGPLEDDV